MRRWYWREEGVVVEGGGDGSGGMRRWYWREEIVEG